MNKNLRKCYECLDLPVSANEQDVEIRTKALIKILENKQLEKGVSCDKEIGEVETASATIIENIKMSEDRQCLNKL